MRNKPGIKTVNQKNGEKKLFYNTLDDISITGNLKQPKAVWYGTSPETANKVSDIFCDTADL